MSLARLNQQITFIQVSDLDESAVFYTEILGLELALDQGGCRIYRISDSAFVGLCEKVEPLISDGVIVTLVTDDVDGWHDRLRSAGVHIDSGPSHNPVYDIYHCFVRDPDGWRVEIQRFCNPAWLGVD